MATVQRADQGLRTDNPIPPAQVLLHLPSPLPVEGAALGQSFPTVIAGTEVTVTVPPAQNPNRAVADGPWIIRKLVTSWSSGAALETDISALDHKIAFGWYRLVLSWLCAWLEVSPPDDATLPPVVELIDERGEVVHREAQNFQFIGFSGQIAATPAQLAVAFEHAGRLVELPAEHAMCVRAQMAYDKFDERACLIDACTATELAASGAIEDRLKSDHCCPPAFVDKTIRRARGLVALIAVCRSLELGPGVTDHEIESLAAARNRSAHAGVTFERDDTHRSLTTARRVVQALRPLEVPG